MMVKIDQIDGIDRKIVRELQRDAAISHAALAEKVGASSASCLLYTSDAADE